MVLFSLLRFILILITTLSVSSENHIIAPTSLLVVVPGHGSHTRWAGLKESLHSLQKSCAASAVEFHCVIFAYNRTYTPHLKKVGHKMLSCDIIENDGFWTHHMLKANASGYTHVAVLMDDFNTTAVSIPRAIAAMNRFKFDTASAAIPNWHYRFMRPSPDPECIAHEVNFVDILFTLFTAKAWACWQSLIDLDTNYLGWGYDRVFKTQCGVRMGVLDKEIGTHELQFGYKTRLYDTEEATMQYRAYLKKLLGTTTFKTDRLPASSCLTYE